MMDASDMLDGTDGIDEARWEQAMTKRRRTRKSDEVPQWVRDLSKRTVESARAQLASGTAVSLPDGTTATVVTRGIGGAYHIDVEGTILRDWPRDQLTAI